MKAVFLAIGLLVATAVTPALLNVQAMAADEICPAVYPCDADGNVIPPYDTADGACAEKFRVQCSSEKANLVGEKLAQCESSKAEADENARKTIRKLRKQLKSRN